MRVAVERLRKIAELDEALAAEPYAEPDDARAMLLRNAKVFREAADELERNYVRETAKEPPDPLMFDAVLAYDAGLKVWLRMLFIGGKMSPNYTHWRPMPADPTK